MLNFLSSGHAFAALIFTWAVGATALKETVPWIFWLTVITLPAAVLVQAEWKFLNSRRGRQISLLCLGMLAVHVCWAFGRSGFYDAAQPVTYWNDDHNYYNEAAAIAEAWSDGIYPEFWRKGSPPYLGTLHTGYHRPLSTIFFLAGPGTLPGLLLNALCASLFPLLMAIASRYLWVNATTPECAHAHRDPVMITAVLTAVHPSQFYWASYILKDVYVAFVFLVALVLLLGAWQNKSIPYAISSLLVLPYLFTVRMYTAVSLIAGAACLPILRMRTRTIMLVVTSALAAIIVFCIYTLQGFHLYRQIRDSFTALAPTNSGSPVKILKQISSGIPRLFLAPYAWLRLDRPTPMYGLYPGMWFLYLLAYPLAFSGLSAALRQNIKAAVIPIAAFGLGSLLFLTAAYEGNASRQRFYLEYIIILFAAYGFVHPSRWWIGGILLAEAAFAIGQVVSLR